MTSHPNKIGSLLATGRTLVIAEAGVNHNGDVARALDMVDVAADAGADVVKFQTFRADRLTTSHAPKADYQLQTTSPQESQQEMLRSLELGASDYHALAERSRARGITFLSTPFDEESVDLLERVGVEAYKVPSGEITNGPLLRKIAAQGKDVILSTGMSCLGEVERAVAVFAESWSGLVRTPLLALLHCVTNYPARAEEVNLRAMATLLRAFGLPVGYSDHTLGLAVPLGAVALGACIVEKHFTLDRSLPGPDHRASLEPGELRELVQGIRQVEVSLGDGHKRATRSEESTRTIARKSLVMRRGRQAGELLRHEDLDVKRPGTGLEPSWLDRVVGLRLTRNVPPDHVLTWADLKSE